MSFTVLLNPLQLSAATLLESNTSPRNSIINCLSTLGDTLQNLWWLAGGALAVFFLIKALFFFSKKANNYTRDQINRLKENKKYIPGLFIELNESKEVLRYFVHGQKWKIRLIRAYNLVYDNAYGDILKRALDSSPVAFRLKRKASLQQIKDTVRQAEMLHSEFEQNAVEFKPDYRESQYLFNVVYYPYSKALEELQHYSEAANSRYMVLTGSAGNGKTNLLCSIGELLIALKEAVLFVNARDIKGDILPFLAEELKLPDIVKKHFSVLFYVVNFLLAIRRKRIFIIIDAVNENDTNGFGAQLVEFLNMMFKYSRVKVIVSCRNEYYRKRFRDILVDKVYAPAVEFDLKEQHYDSAALDRIIIAYSRYFNYSGTISPVVKNVLSKQLLLLRIFFEVNAGKSEDVLSVRKHEIFAQYIEVLKCNNGEVVEQLLKRLVRAMLESGKYDEVSLAEIAQAEVSPERIKSIVDGSILISKKLMIHEGTIAQSEQEVIYFVFDEMRDYCLARQILLDNISADKINTETIFTNLRRLCESRASCVEGVLHYIYVFFRTDNQIKSLDQSGQWCREIIELYRMQGVQESQVHERQRYGEEFQDLGLRTILTSGLSLTDFEKDYIRDCLRKDPRKDGGTLFDTLMEGTVNARENDLDDYLDILLGLKAKDDILKAFYESVARIPLENKSVPECLIDADKMLRDTAPHKATQIQKVAELFLLCFEMKDKQMQRKLTEYFVGLPNHDAVRQEVLLQFRTACEVNADA